MWSFSHRHPSRHQITRESYEALHKELILKCRSLADRCGSTDPVYYELADVVKPWINPQVLSRTDHELLISLLNRCGDIQRQLGGRTWTWSTCISGSSFRMILASVIVATLLLWSGTTEALFSTIIDRLRDWSTLVLVTIKWSNDSQRIFFGGGVLVIVTLIVAVREARR